MRKVISYFIRYQVAVNVIVLAFIAFGIIGLMQMKSSFFPLQESEIININLNYPGATPQEIEEGIVLKIEDNLKGLAGIDRVTSTSRQGGGSITVEIEQDEDINVMVTEVKNAVDRVPTFPTDMEPLVIAKEERIRETISFAINGKDVSLVTLKEISRSIETDIRAMEGISQIEITGFPEEEIQIAVRENDLLAYSLSFQEVANAVAETNILTSAGNIKTSEEDLLIRATNRSYYADELNNTVVRANSNGTLVKLEDVASVRDQFSETPNASFFNGKLAVNINVSNTNNEDLISTAEQINTYVKEYNASHEVVQLDVTRDSSVRLNQRTELLVENGIIGILLVLLFLSFFLNTRLAFWVAFGLPVAFLGMFIFAGSFGVTINVLSLFGMIIVIGILIDDGIVISENIYQHYEMGKSPMKAAVDGTMEVIPPIISAIITTVLAFATFQFLDSRIGEFFAEVSVVVILTLIVSLIEALIILPAHIGHSKALTKETEEERNNKKGIDKLFYKLRWFNKKGDQFMLYCRDKIYSPVLKLVLRQRFISFAIVIGAFIITVGAIGGGIIRITLFPSIASDTVSINLLMAEGTNPKLTDSVISMVEKSAWQVNDEFTEKQTGNKAVVENIIKRVGPGNNKASLRINLLPGEERDFGAPEITNAVRDKVGKVYGVEQLTFGSGGNFGGSPVSVSLLGNNTEELKAATEDLRTALESNPLLKDITDTDPEGAKELNITLKDNAYALGLNLNSVMGQIRGGFFGAQAQRFQRGQDEIRVWVRYGLDNRNSLSDLDDMRILTPGGERVPFQEIANYSIKRGEESIRHLNGLREIQVNADMEDPNGSSTEILGAIRQNVMPDITSRYPTVKALYEGQNREAKKLTDSANKVLPIILFLIYAVIAFTFRSYSQPLLLMLMIPLSIIAIGWGHLIHGFAVNVLSALGIIALIGIMVNDGLVLIGKFNSFLKKGMKFDEALYEAGRSRFRAIFLTSITTIAGLAPLLLEKSRQAQFLKPMAISIAYGIGIATVLTLLFLPLLLSATNQLKTNIKWLKTGNEISREEVERAIKEQKIKEDEED